MMPHNFERHRISDRITGAALGKDGASLDTCYGDSLAAQDVATPTVAMGADHQMKDVRVANLQQSAGSEAAAYTQDIKRPAVQVGPHIVRLTRFPSHAVEEADRSGGRSWRFDR